MGADPPCELGVAVGCYRWGQVRPVGILVLRRKMPSGAVLGGMVVAMPPGAVLGVVVGVVMASRH